MPPLNAKVADTAPDEPALTPYDEQHAVTSFGQILDDLVQLAGLELPAG